MTHLTIVKESYAATTHEQLREQFSPGSMPLSKPAMDGVAAEELRLELLESHLKWSVPVTSPVMSKNLLIVEDDRDLASNLITDFLEVHGYAADYA